MWWAALLLGVAALPALEHTFLVGMYNTTDGKGWLNATGWFSYLPECQWAGVTCDATGSHITCVARPHPLFASQ